MKLGGFFSDKPIGKIRLTSHGTVGFEVRQGRIDDRDGGDKATTDQSEKSEDRKREIELHDEVFGVLEILLLPTVSLDQQQISKLLSMKTSNQTEKKGEKDVQLKVT